MVEKNIEGLAQEGPNEVVKEEIGIHFILNPFFIVIHLRRKQARNFKGLNSLPGLKVLVPT